MQRFIIEGGHQLRGSIRPTGNKNAALPLLAATLLTNEPVILQNLPEIGDVITKRRLLADLGRGVSTLLRWQHTSPIRISHGVSARRFSLPAHS
jgi:UDP-N-acetylglucosamine enolpyruvyl transferase